MQRITLGGAATAGLAPPPLKAVSAKLVVEALPLNFAASRAPDVLYTKTGTGRRHAYLELVLTYLKCYIASPDKVAPSLSTKFAASAAAAARLIDGDGMPHGGRERASASPFSRGHQMYRPTGSFGDSTSSLKASAEYDGTRGSNTLFPPLCPGSVPQTRVFSGPYGVFGSQGQKGR